MTGGLCPRSGAESAWRPAEAWRDLLVDRETVLAEVDRAVTDLLLGQCAVLHVTSAPGGGLTAVLDHVASTARARGAAVVRGRCSLEESTTSLTVAMQVLTSLETECRAETRPSADDLAAPSAEFLVGLCQVVLGEARRRPLAVLVDDAQWIDLGSLKWLGALARRVAQAPLLLVVATSGPCRPGAVITETDVQESMAALWTGVLPLPPLSRSGVARLLAAAHPMAVEPAFVDAVIDYTGGIPGVVQHVLARLAAEGCRPSAEEASRVPGLAASAIRDDLDRRIQVVTGAARRLLNAMAVGEGTFDVRQAAAMAGLTPAARVDGIGVLESVGLIVGRDDPRLSSRMTVDRVLASMTRDEREELHATAAHQGYLSAIADEEIARLLLGAAPVGTPWAVTALRNAATSSRQAGDYRGAVDYFDRVLREPLTEVERTGLLVECGAVEVLLSPDAGDWRLARVLATEGEDELGPNRLAAADLLVARGNCGLVRRVLATMHVREELGTAERATMCALYWSADEAPHDQPELSPHVMPELPAEPIDLAQAGVAGWKAVADGTDIAGARRLARIALGDGVVRNSLLVPRLLAARTLMLTDDIAESMMALDAVVLEARRRHVYVMAGQALLARAKIAARQGFLDEASADLERALGDVPLHCWHPTVQPSFVATGLVLALESGRFEEAERIAATTMLSGAEAGFSWTHLLFARGMLDLYTGDPASAIARFDECGRHMLARRWVNPAFLAWRTYSALALRAVGRQEEATRLVVEEVRLAQLWNAPSTTGGAHLGAGMVLDGPEALAHKEKAVAILRHSASRLRYATALVDLAGARQDRVDEARELLAEAELIAVSHGAGSLVERVRVFTANLPHTSRGR